MALSNCPRCGRLYDNTFKDICQQCTHDEEQLYIKVRKYIKENRSCTIYEASEATDVPVSLITRFIKQGRISMKNNPNMMYPCETCGTPIGAGRFCNQCIGELTKGFTDAVKKSEPETKKLRDGDNKQGYHFEDFKRKS
jgi:flagellar operon protein (TIGR03826 family)